MERRAPVVTDRTIVDVLRMRALRQPDRPIYTYLLDGEVEAGGLTFAELDRRARAIGAALQACTASGDRLLLLLPSNLELVTAFFGCLYAGVVAVPAYPPQSRRHLPRLLSIVEDARPAVVLTSAALLPRLQRLCAGAEGRLATLRWVAGDLLSDDLAADWGAPALVPESLAFLQYTSGSTAAPKGVMVSHGNLIHNEEMIQRAFGQSEDSVVVGWLPLYHDMGLIGNLLQPLFAGARCILMSPMAFLQRPARWLEAVARYRATTSGGPNFAYELCVRRVGEEARSELDLSSWQVAFSGAEPGRAATLERFIAAFAPCGFRREAFYPCYGLAEATLFVSGGLRNQPPRVEAFAAAALEENRAEPAADGAARRELVSCGRAWMEQQAVIADPVTGIRCVPGRVGEIWISGPSVAMGYWGLPEATERDFRAGLAGEPEAGLFLRTGDLGFVAGGDLFITGRLKDLIVLRGRNHYPQDLELTSERAHPALRTGCVAAFSVEVDGEERLVLACEVEDQTVAAGEIGMAIRQAVAEEHEVRVHEVLLLRAGTIPKTTSGKVQRHACRKGWQDGSLAVLGRSGAVHEEAGAGEPVAGALELQALPPDERLAALIAWLGAEVAGLLEIPVSRVPVEMPLTALGLDSLAAAELGRRLIRSLGVEVSPAALLAGADLAGLAREALEQLGAKGDPAGPRLTAGRPVVEGPLSFGQKALWFLHRLAPEGGVHQGTYHIASAARVRPVLDSGALRRTLEGLVRRHPALRTTFHELDGEPRQRIHSEPRLDLMTADATAWSEAELRRRLEEEAFRPFDLEKGPLLRAGLFRRSAGEDVVLLAVHHLVADFWTLGVLVRELGVLWAEHAQDRPAALAPLPVTYADWVRWQEERIGGAEGERLRRFWESRLADAPPELALPVDRRRSAATGDAGGAVLFRIDSEQTWALRALARSQGATLFTALLALFQALLHRMTGETDILVGSPTSGRSRPEIAGLVGYLANLVVLRCDLDGRQGAPGFAAFLGQVRKTVLEAFEHQDYPFPLLAETLALGREPGRTPLVRAVCVLQKAAAPLARLGAFAVGEPGVRLDLGGLELESLPLDERFAQFELTLRAAELEERIAASFLYCADLFDAATVARLAGHCSALLAAALEAPGRSLGELPLLSPGERHQLVAEWTDTAAPTRYDRRVHELVEAQAQARPEAVAVVQNDLHVTYAVLERRAAELANRLRSLGVRSEVPVGLCAERSPDLVVGALAIWKAGGAYVPLDPAYPPEHLAFAMEDTAMPVLLTQRRLAERIPGDRSRIVLLDDLEGEAPATAPAPPGSPLERAYVIYTSGSTGRPKGVDISQSALLNLLSWHLASYPMVPGDRISQLAGLAFDATVWELWPALAAGAVLHLAGREETRWEPRELRDWLVERQVRVSFLPTPLAEAVLLLEWPRHTALEVLLTGGDRLLARPPAGLPFRLVNHYGPTENTVVATCASVAADGSDAGRPPAIGRPLPNVGALLLDSALQPVPVGVPGELCLGGASLARGYLGWPDLTAEKFVPHPWSGRPGERMYRTGDLVRRRADGALEFLGRIDHQVKIRGFRAEPGEVEAALRAVEGVRDAVVVAQDSPGGRRLIAYVVGEAAANELRQHLRRRLPEPMVPAFFVALPELPLTPNGKIDRRALPEPECAPAEPGGPGTPVEELLAGIWAEVLGLERVGLHDSFFDLGGHSLLATRVLSRLRRVFSVELPVRALFERPTVAELATAVEAARSTGGGPAPPPPVPVPRGGEMPASFAQERLWFLDRMEPGTPTYNMPGTFDLNGRLDVAAFTAALRGVVERHEVLRTVFRQADGKPRQRILPKREIRLPLLDLAALPPASRRGEAERLAAEHSRHRFDLARGPLLAATLVRLGPERHLLLIVVHHVVCDGWSLALFVREIGALYAACTEGQPAPLPELPIQYADFAVWQREVVAVAQQAELAWWLDRLGGEIAPLDLPTDRPRPAVQTYRGGRSTRVVSPACTARLAAFGRTHGATLFMTLLAAIEILLHRYSGQDDILVGTPVAGRRTVETETLIGCFLNTLVLRTGLGGRPGFRDVVTQVRETALGAYSHQDVPFEAVLAGLPQQRDLSRTPLFQVMVNLLNFPSAEMRLPGLVLERRVVAALPSKFDMTFYLSEEDGGVRMELVYNADLFEAGRMDEALAQLAALLEQALERPDEPAGALSLVTAAARALLPDPAAVLPVAWMGAVHERFAERARLHPARPAVRDGDGTWSYGDLEAAAGRLGAWLHGCGVRPGDRVAVYAHRSAPLALALLGTLKAGAAFTILDPSYPALRLTAVLAAVAPRAFLRLEAAGALPAEVEDWLRGAGCPELVLPRSGASALPGPEGLPGEAPGVSIGPDAPAYVAFTSGSTGVPKGVVGSHRPLSHFITWHAGRFALTETDRFSLLAGLAHDPLLRDMFTPLCLGALLTVPAPEDLALPDRFARWMHQEGVTVAHLTPALGELLSEGRGVLLDALRLVFFGGDVLTRRAVERLRGLAPGCACASYYGATETPQGMGVHEVEPADRERIPLGRGIDGVQLLVLNAEEGLAGVGELGEICIRSPYLSSGYLGDEELTRERFAANPFTGAPGDRLYRTGDLGRYLPDGEVELKGRRDTQVKIRGFRVELGEIEAVLAALPGVREVAVVARDGRADRPEEGGGDLTLVAFVTASGERAPAAGDLRTHLEKRLPSYMVPAGFKVLAQLPRTSNGKIDRAALAALGSPVEEREGGMMPGTSLEKVLAGMIGEVLGIDRVGLHDNFFDLGGHSMRAVELIARLRDTFGIDVPLFHVFDVPTVAGLASVLLESPEWGQTVEELASALLQVMEPASEPMVGAAPTEAG